MGIVMSLVLDDGIVFNLGSLVGVFGIVWGIKIRWLFFCKFLVLIIL